jgi:hypothetical protein
MSKPQSKDDSRSFCDTFFRQPQWYPEIEESHPPIDPSTSWVGETLMVTGLSPHVVIPPCVKNRLKPRTGRVIRWQADIPIIKRYTVVYAIFCANLIDSYPPPYPGGLPDGFHQYCHPRIAFSDGSKGRWDPRRFPQLFDPKRPWLGFHSAPASSTDVQQPRPIFYGDVFEFWHWNDPAEPLKGGWWDRPLLRSLFDVKAQTETSVQLTIRDFSTKVDLTCYSLPWRDDLTLKVALEWVSLQEGRDTLGHTLAYLAEIEAFTKWLRQAAELANSKDLINLNADHECPPGNRDLVGVWAPTIQTAEEWEFLAHCRVPIYMILEVPEGHSLYGQATPGALDNDERYRINSYDRSLGRGNHSRLLHAWEFTSQQDTSLISRLCDLPEAIILPSNRTPMAPCLNPTIVRNVQPLTREESLRRYKERVHFSTCPPKRHTLNAATDQHPLLRVIPETREPGVTFVKEMKHTNYPFYWPSVIKSEEEQILLVHNSRYRFDYLQDRVTILSDFPFPGREPTLGESQRVALLHESCEDPALKLARRDADLKQTVEPRKYWREEPGANQDTPAYVWAPERTVQQAMTPVFGPNGILIDLPFSRPQILEQMHQVALTNQGEDALNPFSGLLHGRACAERNANRRLFRPRNDNRAEKLLAWNIPFTDSLSAMTLPYFCFPLRIANIDGDSTIDAILGLLEELSVVDIVLYCSYSEVDTTRTVDLGLRYAEDALCIWSTLHGYKFGGRIIEAYPLSRMVGKATVPSPGFSSRSFLERQSAVTAVSQKCASLRVGEHLSQDVKDLSDQLSVLSLQVSSKGQGIARMGE